jgi:hypothetical protein
MMKLHALLLLCIVLPADAVGSFSDLWDFLVSGTCRRIEMRFNDSVACDCIGKFNTSREYFFRLSGEATCELSKPVCLIKNPSDLYCGNVNVDVDFIIRKGATNVTGCFDVKSNFPPEYPTPVKSPPSICVSVIPRGPKISTFKSCSVTYDGKPCTSCTVCQSKSDIKFDCRNININPVANSTTVIQGPYTDTCIDPKQLFFIN